MYVDEPTSIPHHILIYSVMTCWVTVPLSSHFTGREPAGAGVEMSLRYHQVTVKSLTIVSMAYSWMRINPDRKPEFAD